jgi:hypothetical protein
MLCVYLYYVPRYLSTIKSCIIFFTCVHMMCVYICVHMCNIHTCTPSAPVYVVYNINVQLYIYKITVQLYIPHVHVPYKIVYRVAKIHRVRYNILHFLQMSLQLLVNLAENDLYPNESYESWPPCMLILYGTHCLLVYYITYCMAHMVGYITYVIVY